jgi:hypothetical protein
MLSKEKRPRLQVAPRRLAQAPELRVSGLWPWGRLTHALGQLCARHGEYAFTPGRGPACCAMEGRGEAVEPRFPEWWDKAERDLAPHPGRI